MIRTDEEDHQVLVTFETVRVRCAFAVRPWVSTEDLRVAIEDLAKECGRAVDVATDVDTWDLAVESEPDRERLVTDGGEDVGSDGEYRYATVVRSTEYDPRNDVKEGQIRIVAGRHPDGWSYTIHDEEKGGFRDIESETLGVVGPADHPMSKRDIRAWAAERDEASAIAERAIEDESDEKLVTDGGHEMAPSMEGIDDELLHVPDRFREGGHLPGKDIKRARLVEVETPHPGPDRQVLEIHTEDGVAYRYQRYESSEDFTWFHWQRPGQDPREKHPNIPYGIQVFVGLINGEGLDRFKPELKTVPALDPEESQEIRTDGGIELDPADAEETVTIDREAAETALFELNHLIDATGGPDVGVEDANTPIAEVRRIVEASEDLGEFARQFILTVIDLVGEERGVETNPEADPLTDRTFRARHAFAAALKDEDEGDEKIASDGGQQTEAADDQETFYNVQEANETNTVGLGEFDRPPTSSMLTRFNTHILRRAILEYEREFDQRDVFLRQYEDPNGHPAIALHAGPATTRAIVAAGMIHKQAMTDGGQDVRELGERLKQAVGKPGRKRDVVELSLRDALEASDNREVNFHIRQALQLLDADREGIR